MVLVSETAMHEAQAELTDALGSRSKALRGLVGCAAGNPRPAGPAVVIVTGSNA